jgi:S-adenosylmethionine hydrolase
VEADVTAGDDAPVVALLTDFGSRDVFVGVVKGVILRGEPRARIVDVTHEVPAQDVRAGAFALEAAVGYFPAGTIHVAVVDPGVGGRRRVIAARAGEWSFLGPDNGLLAPALERCGGARVVALSQEAIERARERAMPAGSAMSTTFHGRDVFAPVAALMAGGAALEDLGSEVRDHARLVIPEPEVPRAGEVTGEVLHVDRFGNLVTNIRPSDLALDGASSGGLANVSFEIEGVRMTGLSRTYVDRAPGEPLALVGSTGRVEVSVREGSAAETLGVSVGAKVTAHVRQ